MSSMDKTELVRQPDVSTESPLSAAGRKQNVSGDAVSVQRYSMYMYMFHPATPVLIQGDVTNAHACL